MDFIPIDMHKLKDNGLRSASVDANSPTVHRVSLLYFGSTPPARIPVANEGLGWDSLLNLQCHLGDDCYWEGGHTQIILHPEF